MADEARELAKRIVRLEKAQAALGRSRQIARSTVDIDVDGVQVATPVPEALSKGVAARAVADAAADEARDAKQDAVLALQDATTALSEIGTLEADLTAEIGAAQSAADEAAQDASDALDEALQVASDLEATQGDVETALTGGVSVDRLYADGAVFDTAVIDSLVADDAFAKSIYTNKVIVDAQDFAPGPGGQEPAYEFGGLTTTVASSIDPTGRALRANCGSGTMRDRFVTGPSIRVSPGSKILVKMVVGSASPTSNGIVIMDWGTPAAVPDFTNFSTVSTVTPGSPDFVGETVVTVPAGVSVARLGMGTANGGSTGYWFFRQLDVRPQVGAIQIENGAIRAPHITASEELSAKVGEFLEVKASQLVADTAAMNNAFIDQLVGDDAFLGSLYTNRVIVDAQDFAPGPLGYESAWTVSSAGLIGSSGVDPAHGALYQTVNNGTWLQRAIVGPLTPVTPGQKIAVEVVIGPNQTPSDASPQVLFYWSTNGTTVNPLLWDRPFPNPSPTSGAQRYSGVVTVPAGVSHGSFTVGTTVGTTGRWYFREMTVRPQVGAVLIENGAVTADKITASEELSAKVGQFLELSTEKLSVGSFQEGSVIPLLEAGNGWVVEPPDAGNSGYGLTWGTEGGQAIATLNPAGGSTRPGFYLRNSAPVSFTNLPGSSPYERGYRMAFWYQLQCASPSALSSPDIRASAVIKSEGGTTIMTISIPEIDLEPSDINQWRFAEVTTFIPHVPGSPTLDVYVTGDVGTGGAIQHQWMIRDFRIAPATVPTLVSDDTLVASDAHFRYMDTWRVATFHSSALFDTPIWVQGTRFDAAYLSRAGSRAAGAVNITTPAAGQTTSVQVTLPSGRFTGTPTVVATPRTVNPGSVHVSTAYHSATAFTIYLKNVNSGFSGQPVEWIAVEG